MGHHEKLERLRSEIDRLDVQIVDLLNERARIVLDVREVKRQGHVPLFDPKREEEIFRRLAEHNAGPLYDDAFREIYDVILHWMKTLEEEG